MKNLKAYRLILGIAFSVCLLAWVWSVNSFPTSESDLPLSSETTDVFEKSSSLTSEASHDDISCGSSAATNLDESKQKKKSEFSRELSKEEIASKPVSSITLGVGESYKLKDIDISDSSSVKSDNPEIAVVNVQGEIEANKVVRTLVTAAVRDKAVIYEIVVKKAPTSISLNQKELKITVGSRFDFNTVLPDNSASYHITYSSSNSVIAGVKSSGGLMTAKQKGTAVITATTYNGVAASCIVTILPEHNNTAFDDLKATNPNYKDGLQWQVNCQRCVPTYELRRRGYDVTAQPNNNEDYTDVWANCKEVAERTNESAFAEMTEGKANNATKEDIEILMKQWGDGARAQVTINWQEGTDGHTFIAERIDGKTYYLDPQSGETNLSDIFKYAKTEDTSIWRIDNVETSELINYCYISNTGRNYYFDN